MNLIHKTFWWSVSTDYTPLIISTFLKLRRESNWSSFFGKHVVLESFTEVKVETAEILELWRVVRCSMKILSFWNVANVTHELNFLFLLKYSWFTMFCQFMLHSKVIQSYIYTHSFCHTVFYHVVSQEIRYSSLCYMVGCHCLSILNVIVCIY